MARLGGYLTPPAGRAPGRVALGFVRRNARGYGVEPRDLDTLELADRYTTPDGVTHLRWQQRVAGIPVFDEGLRANVAEGGRLVNLVGSPRSDLELPSLEPRLGARAALGAALRDAGSNRPAPRRAGPPRGPARETDFGRFNSAELTLFGAPGRLRLAWRVIADAGPAGIHHAAVDANSGEVLRRTNLTVEANNASVWDFYPGAPAGGTARTVDLSPWLTNPATTSELIGPYAWVWADFSDDNVRAFGPPGGGNCAENICPSNFNGPAPYQWVWPYSPVPNYPEGNCPSAGCTWDSRVGGELSWQQNLEQTGVQAFYFVNNFHDHLATDPGIAFNSASNNFEGADDNVWVNVVDGAATGPDGNHSNNANMTTLPEGSGALMQMYLWEPTPGAEIFRSVNGSDDASIVYHEYAHGLSARLVVDFTGAAALNGAQPGAMGEGWSDWYAMDYLAAQGFVTDTATPGQVRLADFEVTNNAFRTQGLDCPVGSSDPLCPGTPTAGPGGYTYGDFGKLHGEAEVHDDGEIWAEALWDLRSAVGAATARNLITGGMRLSNPNPSFLDMRDAILQQAKVVGGDDLFYAVWPVFAARGMGQNASTTGPDDTAPVEDFTAPERPDTTAPALSLRGRKRQRAGPAVKVRVGCDEVCVVRARGNLTIAVRGARRGARRVSRAGRVRRTRLRRARANLEAGEKATLRLRLRPRARRPAGRYGGVARLVVTATDAAGNKSKRKRRVLLVPRRRR